MIIEQWAATHFDEVTRRVECGEKTLFATKVLFDIEKRSHEAITNRLNLGDPEKAAMASYMKTLDIPRSPDDDSVETGKKRCPPHETAIRINSPFYIDETQIVSSSFHFPNALFLRSLTVAREKTHLEKEHLVS